MSTGDGKAVPDRCLIEEYVDEWGRCPWTTFVDQLPGAAASKVYVALERLANGHTSGLKCVASGLFEWRLHWGPGIRIYLHQDGKRLIVLMGGSYGKASQSTEIESARQLVRAYKRRKQSHTQDQN